MLQQSLLKMYGGWILMLLLNANYCLDYLSYRCLSFLGPKSMTLLSVGGKLSMDLEELRHQQLVLGYSPTQ